MPRRVLLIDGKESRPPAEARDQPGDRLDLRYDRTDWSSFRPESLGDHAVDLVIPVAVADESPALRLFNWLREHPTTIPLLAILSASPGPDLLRAVAETADDFILAPVREEEWRVRVRRILGEEGDDIAVARRRLTEEIGLGKLIGTDPAFLKAIERIPVLARSGRTVLLTGETGTGKELFARAIHHLSLRRNFAFIPVDCAAFPDYLFENELFGHARGAFTDAHSDQKGIVAMANGGTLFLDEIDSLSMPAQAKLLRFLQERTYKPLGAERFLHADVNLLAATNRDLEQLIRERSFRADLFFRLNVLRLHLKPLRERQGDIPILARHFATALAAEESAQAPKVLTAGALRKLQRHDWPGNIRELSNVIRQAMVFAEGAEVLSSDIDLPDAEADAPGGAATGGFRQARALALATFERTYVEGMLRKCSGNVTRAAREAEKERRAFGRLVKKYQVSRAP